MFSGARLKLEECGDAVTVIARRGCNLSLPQTLERRINFRFGCYGSHSISQSLWPALELLLGSV